VNKIKDEVFIFMASVFCVIQHKKSWNLPASCVREMFLREQNIS